MEFPGDGVLPSKLASLVSCAERTLGKTQIAAKRIEQIKRVMGISVPVNMEERNSDRISGPSVATKNAFASSFGCTIQCDKIAPKGP